MNNFMPRNLKIQMKWTNSCKKKFKSDPRRISKFE